MRFHDFVDEMYLISLEHKTGVDLTVSSTLKKPSKNYACFILRRFGLFLMTWRCLRFAFDAFASQHCSFLRHKAIKCCFIFFN